MSGGEIEITRESLEKTIFDKDKLKDILAECEQHQKQLEAEIKVVKKKFLRDADDYKLQRVYTWRHNKSTHSWWNSSRKSEF